MLKPVLRHLAQEGSFIPRPWFLSLPQNHAYSISGAGNSLAAVLFRQKLAKNIILKSMSTRELIRSWNLLVKGSEGFEESERVEHPGRIRIIEISQRILSFSNTSCFHVQMCVWPRGRTMCMWLPMSCERMHCKCNHSNKRNQMEWKFFFFKPFNLV